MSRKKDPARVEHAVRAEAKALALIDKLRPLDRAAAEDYVRANPPDVETIVALAFVGQRKAAKAPRLDALSTEIGSILKAKPKATTADVIDALQDRGALEKRLEDSEKINIGKRVSRLRKKLSSR
jgi:hypothetical protein